jgi:hypothetical protein
MTQNFNPKSEVFNLKEHEERINKLISKQYSASFMSNAKWEKLFRGLDTENILITHIILKRVDRKDPIITYMPKTEDIEGIWVSEGKNDCNYFYKEIEWIELINVYKPSNIPSQYVHQTIELAASIISKIGQFEIESTDTGLRIYGHKT